MTKLCECGCGEPAPTARKTRRSLGHVKGAPIRFINRHAIRFGPTNHRYNGGICIRDDGRAVICGRDGSLRFFYRVIMEAHLGRALSSGEVVHHRNGDPSDDRLENLELMTRAAHIDHHRADLGRGLA